MMQQAIRQTARIERFLSAALDLPVTMAVVSKGATTQSPTVSSAGSCGTPRQDGTSRKALAQVMRRLGDGNAMKARRLQVPHKQYSLTHTADITVAVGVVTQRLRGIGVDLEENVKMPLAGSALILTRHERRKIDQHDGLTTDTLLRLWTVKEALFKADPNNHRRGWISAYETLNPQRWIGRARLRTELCAHQYYYATVALDRGFLTVAVSFTR